MPIWAFKANIYLRPQVERREHSKVVDGGEWRSDLNGPGNWSNCPKIVYTDVVKNNIIFKRLFELLCCATLNEGVGLVFFIKHTYDCKKCILNC